jgi:2-haloacid dehalogenase
MRFTGFEALSFDCYGTLIDWDTGISGILGAWARSRGLDADAQQLLSAFARHEAAAQDEYPADLYPAILARTFAAIGAELGAEVSDQDAAALATSVPDWPAFADTPGALTSLGKRFKLIILSNVDRASLAGTLPKLGATFTSVLTAQDIGSYKPSPRNFAALIDEARRLGVGEGRLLHVAQSLYHDHVPAQRAGLPTVWIDRHRDHQGGAAGPARKVDVRPDAQFATMADFAAAVEAEGGGGRDR